MFKPPQISKSIPKDFSIPKEKSIKTIIKFLESRLPLFPQDLTIGVHSEDEITQECWAFLQREAARASFMFQFQYKYPGTRRTIDMAVISAESFASKKPLIVIEAKRLPTPGKVREKEYVYGNLGAIERFKRSYHGSELNQSIVLGYIQKSDFNFWHGKVCEWINALIKLNNDKTIEWSTSDLLIFQSIIGGMNKYVSINTRISHSPIRLFHYWLNLTA